MSDFSGPGLLVPMDVAQRILETPGARRVNGLFDMPVLPPRGAPPVPPPAGLGPLIDALRAMLRDLTFVNVRMPSTLAPPFRSLNFYFKTGVSFALGLTQTTTVLFNGNSSVPTGTNAVITSARMWVGLVSPIAVAAADPLDMATTWVNASRCSLLVNGSAVAGFQDRIADAYEVAEIPGVANLSVGVNHLMTPLAAPIPLNAGDVVTMSATVPSLALNCLLEVTGYLYPTEITADGIRGTMADRSGE